VPNKAWWNLWLARGGKGPPPPEDRETPDESMYDGPIPPGAQGLTDLARGMQHVALCTQDILGQHFVNVFNHYVDPVTREAIETRIKLPNGQVMDVALIALIPPTTLALKTLKLKMAVAVNAVEVKATQYDKGMREVDRSRFHVSFGPSDADNTKRKRGGQKMMDLEMTFESCDVPEAVHKVIDHFTQFVEPQDEDKANQYGVPKNGGGHDRDHDGVPDPTPTADAPVHGPPDAGLPVIDADDAPLHDAPERSWDGPDVDPNAMPDEPTTADPQDDTQEIELPDDPPSDPT